MKLFILRHGEAIPDFMNDDARALTEVGIAHAKAQGQRLAKLIDTVDLMAVSPLVRTQQTADYVSGSVNVSTREVWPELLHGASPQPAEAKLCANAFSSVLFVSHMPLVASLESYLVNAEPMSGRAFQTAELSVLESDECYPGAWKLLARYRAND